MPVRRHVRVDVIWNEVTLASEIAPLPVALDAWLAAHTTVRLRRSIRIDLDTHGALRAHATGGRWMHDTSGALHGRFDDLAVRVATTERDADPPRGPADRALRGAFVASLFVHALLFAVLRAAPEPPLAESNPHRFLHPAEIAVDSLAPIVGTDAVGDPLAPLAVSAPTPAPARAARVAPLPQILPGFLTSDDLRALNRASDRFVHALDDMATEPPHLVRDDPDAPDMRGLGRVGIGFGAGCVDGDNCRPVAVTFRLGDTWRPRARDAAREPMRARITQSPTLRPVLDEPGELSMNDVQRIVRHDLLADVVRCYTERSEQSALPAGRMVVRFTIEPNGRVASPSILSSAIEDAPTQQCVTHRLASFAFPPSSSGIAVTYPFVFSSLMPDR